MAFPLRAPSRATKYTAAEIQKRVGETARMLEIHDLLHRYPKELSGGQKQRVGLGRALVRDSELFLLDEPIAHLDAKLRHHMRGELKRLQKKSGRTTVLATPDYSEVVAMADRAAVLNHGVIEQIGTPVELFTRPVNVVVAQAHRRPAHQPAGLRGGQPRRLFPHPRLGFLGAVRRAPGRPPCARPRPARPSTWASGPARSPSSAARARASSTGRSTCSSRSAARRWPP